MNPKIFLALLAVALMIVGCGSSNGGTGGPDPKSDAAQLDKATKLRAIYDGSKGDYETLDAAKKAEFVKLAGDDKAASELWAKMKGSGAPSAGSPAGGTSGPR